MTELAGQNDTPAQPPRASLASLLADEPALCLAQSVSPAARIQFLILAALVVLLNGWQLRNLVASWLHDPNWGHGFVIPLFSLYLLYQRWGDLLAAPRRTCLWGLPILIAGILAMILCFYPFGPMWGCQLSMTVVVFGLILYLAGPRLARITWLPVFYLALAMPIPEMLYRRLANPLQELAAVASGLLLGLLGAQVNVTASHLSITSISGQVYPLNVIEACSGVRSLLAYLALGVAWAYLEHRPLWQRITLVASAIPIAVLCNILRVSVTCSMYVADRPEMGQEFMHWFMGMVMLVPALGMFFLLSWLLGNLFVEEPETAASPLLAAQTAPEAQSLPGHATAPVLSSPSATVRDSTRQGTLKQLLAPHFLVAATLLALTAGGWNATIHFLKWATQKESVPVPARVRIDPKQFRWSNMPQTLGPFVLARDGELMTRPDGTPDLDGRPDGEIVLDEDMMSALRIGSEFDSTRLARRASNWYGIGIYRDTRAGQVKRLWRLEVYYYTGDLDKVPHVPERCLVAAGATLLASTPVRFAAPQPAPWDRVKFMRTLYEYTDSREGLTRQAVQYYTFDLNGKPESSWESVRLTLGYPWVHRCFFAKVQLAPLWDLTDVDQTDRQAAEFVQHALPEVLRSLPTAADVERQGG